MAPPIPRSGRQRYNRGRKAIAGSVRLQRRSPWLTSVAYRHTENAQGIASKYALKNQALKHPVRTHLSVTSIFLLVKTGLVLMTQARDRGSLYGARTATPGAHCFRHRRTGHGRSRSPVEGSMAPRHALAPLNGPSSSKRTNTAAVESPTDSFIQFDPLPRE